MQDAIQVARHMDVFGHIVVVVFKIRMWKQMRNVLQPAREQIVHRNDIESVFDKPVAQMGTEESGSTGDQHFLHKGEDRNQSAVFRQAVLSPKNG